MFQLIPGRSYCFTYLNHRNEEAPRRVIFQGLDYGSNEWYPEPTWLMRCHDLNKGEPRSFKLTRIKTHTLCESSLRDAMARVDGIQIEASYQ